jgi:hypothetical protein
VGTQFSTDGRSVFCSLQHSRWICWIRWFSVWQPTHVHSDMQDHACRDYGSWWCSFETPELTELEVLDALLRSSSCAHVVCALYASFLCVYVIWRLLAHCVLGGFCYAGFLQSLCCLASSVSSATHAVYHRNSQEMMAFPFPSAEDEVTPGALSSFPGTCAWCPLRSCSHNQQHQSTKP